MRVLTAVLLTLVTLTAVVAIYGALLLRRSFGTTAEPSLLERATVRTVRDMAIPKAARDAENPWKDLDNEDTQREAREHFAVRCALCHANDGSGETRINQNLYPKAPDMRLPGTQNLTDGEIYYIIENGIRLSGMPAWGTPEVAGEDDTWKLVLFIRRLPKITQDEISDMQSFNPKVLTEGSDQSNQQ